MNNKYQNINIPKSLDERIDFGIERAELEKNKNYKIRKNRLIKGSIASILALSILGASNPAFASQIPIIGNVFESIEKNIYFPGNYSEYATAINETVSNRGIDITLSEVLCDGQSLYVTYIVKNNEPFKYTSWDGSDSLDMNQLVIDQSYNKVDFMSEELDSSGFYGLQGEFVDEYTFVGFQKYKLNDVEKMPEEFNFKTKVNYIENYALNDGEKDYIKRGTWAFSVPVKVNKDLRKIVDLENQDAQSDFMKINYISITPYDIKIEVDYKEEYNYYIKSPFRIYDENGEFVMPIESRVSEDGLKETFLFNSPGIDSKLIRAELVKPLYPVDVDKNIEGEVIIEQSEETEVIFDKIIKLDYK